MKHFHFGELFDLLMDFFDFEEKHHRNTASIHMPARISHENTNAIKNAAGIIYKALGCSGFARVDMFLTSSNDIYFNEVNTIPGLIDCSRFPNMLKKVGFIFPQILEFIIDNSIKNN